MARSKNIAKLAYSVEEMAEAIGISKPVGYELIKQEDFPKVRISEKRIVIPIKLLEKWLADHAYVG